MQFKSWALGICVLLAAIGLAHGLNQASFPVHRLLQFSSSDQTFGGQKAALSLSGATLGSPSYSGRVLAVTIGSLKLDTLKQIMSSNKPSSLLFLIPEKDLGAESEKEWTAIEEWLISQTDLKIPVWFASESSETEALYRDLEQMSEQMTLVVESPEPTPIKKVELANVQGLLTGLATVSTGGASGEGEDHEAGDVTKIPTIAITASWDSASRVPGLAQGANSDASGVVALLHVARTISKLYANTRTQARYNVVFLLTSGSHLNYAGTRHWIDSSATGSAVRESLEWVLCLDGLGSAGDMYLHASRPPKDPNAARLYNTFSTVAEQHHIPFSVSQKKINIAESTVSWEHELYARRKILSATLSQFSSPSDRSSLFDTTRKIDQTAFSRNIFFITEVITRLIYHQDLNAPTVASSPNTTLTSGWLDALTRQPRMVPFVDSKHPIVDYLELTLRQFAPDVSKQSFKPDSDRIFFDSISATLTSYRTQPFTFELIFLGIVLALNAAIYTILKGDVAAAFVDFGSLLGWIKGRFISSAPSTSDSKKSKKN